MILIILFIAGETLDIILQASYGVLIVFGLLVLSVKILSSLIDFNRKQYKKAISKYFSDKKDLDTNLIENITNGFDSW